MQEQKRKRIIHGANITPIPSGANIIKAEGLGLHNLIGTPYDNVSLKVQQGQVFAIRGRNGSGKTALLLTLAGRMVFTKGRLEILGYRMPLRAGKVHRRIGLAFFDGLNDLSENQLVQNAIAAELELWGRSAKQEDVYSFMHEWDLLPLANKRIHELNREQYVALGVQLAWVGHPDIIAVDDIESGLTKDQSIELMYRLRTMAHKRNVTILVGVLERDLAAMADTAYYMEKTPATQSEGDSDGI